MPQNDALNEHEAPYTADQLEAGIVNALKAHDMQAAVDILKVLCAVDMERALVVHETMLAGLTVAKVLRESDREERPA